MELTSETSNWQISWKSCKLEWENWTLLAQRQGKWNNGSKACTIKTQVKNKVKNRHKWEPEKLSYIIRVLDINLGCIKVFFFFFFFSSKPNYWEWRPEGKITMALICTLQYFLTNETTCSFIEIHPNSGMWIWKLFLENKQPHILDGTPIHLWAHPSHTNIHLRPP